MRSLKKNKQKLYYSLYSEEIPVYERDEDGNIKYIEVDGKQELTIINISESKRRNPISYAEFCMKQKKNILTLIKLKCQNINKMKI